MKRKNPHLSRKERLLRLLDELPPNRKQAADRHLESCSRCREALEEDRALTETLLEMPVPVPEKSLLERNRIRLRSRIRQEKAARPGSLWDRMNSWTLTIRPVRVAGAAAILLLGIAIGRIVPGASPLSLESRSRSAIPLGASEVGNFSIEPASENRTIQIRFESLQETTLSGGIGDPDIRHALTWALVHNERDNIRLTSVGLLGDAAGDELVQTALIKVLESDPNPGVRLQALKALSALPLDSRLKKLFISVLFQDVNPGIRIEAARILSRAQDPELTPILEQRARQDPFAKSLLPLPETDRVKIENVTGAPPAPQPAENRSDSDS